MKNFEKVRLILFVFIWSISLTACGNLKKKIDYTPTGNSDISSEGDLTEEEMNSAQNDTFLENIENTDTNDTTYSESSSTSPPSSGTSSFSVENPDFSQQPLKLVDYGWYIKEPTGDRVYVYFCGMIYNPNEKLIAEFPQVLVTIKSGDGSILTAEEQMGRNVMPGDTITLCGLASMPAYGLTDDAEIIFDIDWGDFITSSPDHSGARTTDFEIINVTEMNSSNENAITGEVINNYPEDIDTVNLSIVLRKDGEIVYMDNIFLKRLKAGKAKAFEFIKYEEWPEHDTIDVSAMIW